jgi:hypothetical protein
MYIDTLSMSFGTDALTGGLLRASGPSSSGGAAFAVGQTAIGREEIDTFAAEIRRRADLGKAETDAAAADAGQAAESGAKDGSDAESASLAASLADAVDFIRQEYGSDAATAAMGLVLQNVGDGALTEDNLGDGLVAALAFIDRNLGTAAGDRVMARFNGSLNDAMNGYFENGRQELFMAVEGGTVSFGTGTALTMDQIVDDASSSQSAEDGILAMLKNIAVQRDAANARTGDAATAADPYAAYQASYLQTSGMLLDAAV